MNKLTSYQKQKSTIRYLEQCIKELEAHQKNAVATLAKNKIPFKDKHFSPVRGDQFITPYNNGDFFFELLTHYGKAINDNT